MKLVRMAISPAVVAVTLLGSVPAMADPPPSNPNVGFFTFECSRGSETLTFQAVSIVQNAALALQRSDGNGVVIFMHVEVNGQVVFDIPGQAGRSDLWSCTSPEFAGVVADMLLTPRR
jgi:hypothetical protein